MLITAVSALKLEVSVGSSFCRSDDITLVSDHQTSLSIKWYNFPHHGLGWPKLDTFFSKDILFYIFSRISRGMAAVNGGEHVALIDLESSSIESCTKIPKRGLEQVGSNDPPNEVKDGEVDQPPRNIASFELNVQSNNT